MWEFKKAYLMLLIIVYGLKNSKLTQIILKTQ